jgi:hypothetical protein
MGDWIWIHMATENALQAARFYTAVASYDMAERPDTEAIGDLLLTADGYSRAGISQVDDDRPAVWIPFVRVVDAADAANRALALGAELILPPRDDVLGGDLAVITDPTGAVFGLMTWDYEKAAE